MQKGGIETRSELCDNVRHFRSKAHVVSDVVDSMGQFKLKVVEHVLNGPVTWPVWWPGKYAMTSKVHGVEDLYTVVSRDILPHERPLHKAWRPMERFSRQSVGKMHQTAAWLYLGPSQSKPIRW